jgi:hypothetical protein
MNAPSIVSNNRGRNTVQIKTEGEQIVLGNHIELGQRYVTRNERSESPTVHAQSCVTNQECTQTYDYETRPQQPSNVKIVSSR